MKFVTVTVRWKLGWRMTPMDTKQVWNINRDPDPGIESDRVTMQNVSKYYRIKM